VSPIATDQLYRPLHLDRAGRGTIATDYLELAGRGGESVLLYDEHGKRGWLVPELSVSLHFRAALNYSIRKIVWLAKSRRRTVY
jgi:hypothetical protein